MDGGGQHLSTHQLPDLIREWRALEASLNDLSAEVREKRKRVKAVREMIMNVMKGNKIGALNISSGAVMTRTKSTKAPLTKKYITETLVDFFKGNRAQAEACAAYLDEHRPVKATASLTLEPIATPQ
jgi:hypothetical protein